MISLKVLACGGTKPRKVVSKRVKELKSIQKQLSKMANAEYEHARELLEEHMKLFKEEEKQDNQVMVVQQESIDDFFEK